MRHTLTAVVSPCILLTVYCSAKLMCRDFFCVGTVCPLENSLLFCLTAHVTLVEGGSALPVL